MEPTKPGKRGRGTSNKNERGSSADRARRRQYLLTQFGNGEVANCAYCGKIVNVHTMSIDRIIPGCEGGTYRRDNIQPACRPCNSQTGGQLGNERKKAKAVE